MYIYICVLCTYNAQTNREVVYHHFSGISFFLFFGCCYVNLDAHEYLELPTSNGHWRCSPYDGRCSNLTLHYWDVPISRIPPGNLICEVSCLLCLVNGFENTELELVIQATKHLQPMSFAIKGIYNHDQISSMKYTK